MSRRKSGLSASLRTGVSITVLGICLLVIGIICTLSFFQIFSPDALSGRFLYELNRFLISLFGWSSVAIPFLIFLLAGHCFNTKKLTVIHWHTSSGIAITLVGVLGLFGSGVIGSAMQQSIYEGFSGFGGRLIFVTLIIIGVVLFFDIEPQTVVLWLKSLFVSSNESNKRAPKKVAAPAVDGEYISDKLVAATPTKKSKASDVVVAAPVEDSYITDGKKQKTKPADSPPPRMNPKSDDMHVNPVSSAQSQMWVFPSLDLLKDVNSPADRGDTTLNAGVIENTLRSFGIKARVAEVNPGPTVTQYALEVAVGTNISEIMKKSSNLALALASTTGTVRIEAPIPGRSLVGIEIPNKKSELVTIKRLLDTKVFKSNPDPLLVPLGLDVAGETQAASIAKMPHVLIAGTTGSGKSIAVNSWITTILMRTKPSEVRLVLIDPKQVELTGYNGIPHLLTEVITEPSKVVNALRWGVAEMENRYKALREVGVRNIEGYNAIPNIEKKPYIVFFIDELADLMMVAKADIEGLIVRIAQKARAVGIHLVLSTQRPSVNVITGLMKANVPTRLAFNVASGIDSKVIMDSTGAEHLVGKGDMFYSAPDSPRPKRIQGPFVSEKEVNTIVSFIKQHNPLVQYAEDVTVAPKEDFVGGDGALGGEGGADRDALFGQALELIRGLDTASASLFQRRMKVGYARAARILDELHEAGYVGAAEGAKPRKVTINNTPSPSDESLGDPAQAGESI